MMGKNLELQGFGKRCAFYRVFLCALPAFVFMDDFRTLRMYQNRMFYFALDLNPMKIPKSDWEVKFDECSTG
jgi:hypothetical protein